MKATFRSFQISALFLFVLSLATATAQTETVLHSFNGSDGGFPVAGLLLDNSGNLMGTSQQGGPTHAGLVFELTPVNGGGFAYSILHTFSTSGDGSFPFAPLAADGKGHFFGTTLVGGSAGQGTVFELGTMNGHPVERVVYSATSNATGNSPQVGVAFDSRGRVWGGMDAGGVNNQGLIYTLTPGPTVPWTYTQIHRFASGSDGNYPGSTPILDALDNVFGATRFGGIGSPGDGTVYEISPVVGGGFTYAVLYRFSGPDGAQPLGNLIQDGQGNLYGTTLVGGTSAKGTVFELSPVGGGVWSEAVLYSFAGGADGSAPVGGVAMDLLGNLYGTTTTGGGLGTCQNFCGTAFKLTRVGNSWTETILHSFSGPDGASPAANVTLDAAGNLNSTTADGGQFNKGTVFEITP